MGVCGEHTSEGGEYTCGCREHTGGGGEHTGGCREHICGVGEHTGRCSEHTEEDGVCKVEYYFLLSILIDIRIRMPLNSNKHGWISHEAAFRWK